MLGDKKTVVIYTDASVKEMGNAEYRSGLGLVVLFRKKKRFGVKFVSDIEVKSSKDDIAEVEYRALIQGMKEALCTWGDEFKEAYIVSDSTTALMKLTEELKASDPITFNLKLYWIKGHQKYLLNELADFLSNNEGTKQFANMENALIIPDGDPFAEFDGAEYVQGLGRAYTKGKERDKAFGKLRKITPDLIELLK